jgi:predicted O-methyltransferase YrrM
MVASPGAGSVDRKDLWKKFFMVNPFEGFTPDENAECTGWNRSDACFVIAVTDSNAKIMIEVGTWKGAGLVQFLGLMKEYTCADPLAICVDTWLGGTEHWCMPDDPTNPQRGWTYHMCNWKFGRPRIYEEFLSNVVTKNLQDNVIPLSQTSDNAFRLIKLANITADLIYIDGSHEYEDVYRDLENYWQLLNPGGVMLGDDIGWPGVGKAVAEFSDKYDIEYDLYENNFFYFKKSKGKNGTGTDS